MDLIERLMYTMENSPAIALMALIVILGITWLCASYMYKDSVKSFSEIKRDIESTSDLHLDGSKSWRDYLNSTAVQWEIAESGTAMTRLCAGLAKEAGWDSKERETGTELMLIVSEIAEAMEGDRKNLMDDHLKHRPMLEVELADALIRIYHFAGKHDLDVSGAMVEKLVYNTTRADHKLENRAKENGKKY